MFFKGRSKYNWREIFIKYGSRLASLSNHEETYKTLLTTLVEVSGAEGGSILLFDPDLNQFTLKEYLGPAPLSFSVPHSHPLILWLRRDGHPVSRHQIVENSRFLDLKSSALTFLSEWNAELAFPLIAEKKFLGVFNLGPRGEKAFDSEDIELFTTLIGLGSVFIENSHLYETLLKQNQKLSEVARLKTQFVSNITHELRTPLHGILGLADVLLEDPEQSLHADHRRYLEMMKRSGEALLEMVDHILDLTKYQSGLIQLNVKKIDLKKIISEVAQEFADSLARQSCEFIFDWPESTPSVYGDETELKHLLRDLVGNAIKFTSQGTIAVSSSKCGEMLKVCIKDTGVGIDEKDQQTIFEEFRQADGATTRDFGGSGLGLALAKKIVQLHGGRIWVESKKGVGSYFYFTLPLKPSGVSLPLDGGGLGRG
jgi:signal transduction histidine kinase